MNRFNYVRSTNLELVSIEMLAIVVVGLYFLNLARRRQATWETAYFLALPFTDDPFRVAGIQPVEMIGMAMIALNYRKIRLNYVILIGLAYVLFSILGYLTGNAQGTYSILYSLKFVLIGLVFSMFLKKPFDLPISVMRFLVVFTFAMTFLQVTLWLAGLPIHGIFYNGIFPRAKGLAHEPATWSVWLVSLFPFIFHFKLGRFYLWLNVATLVMTLSTFGFLATGSFLVIRWFLSGGRIRLRKSFVRVLGATAAAILVLIVVKPDTLDFLSKLGSTFDKLAFYQQELTAFAGGGQAEETGVDLSGRGRDFTYFQIAFPEHWLLGVGSFNAPYSGHIPGTDLDIAGSNTYLVMPVEIGVVGVSLVFVLLCLHYGVLLRHRKQKSVDFLAYSLNFLLMIGGIRCFGFYDPWYIQAALLRLAKEQETAQTAPALARPPAAASLQSPAT